MNESILKQFKNCVVKIKGSRLNHYWKTTSDNLLLNGLNTRVILCGETLKLANYHGHHKGELNIVAYHPQDNHLIQIESFIVNTCTWKERKKIFRKKFNVGKKYIIPRIFPWFPHNETLEQWAVLWGSTIHQISCVVLVM